jgi:hypothetical protein
MSARFEGFIIMSQFPSRRARVAWVALVGIGAGLGARFAALASPPGPVPTQQAPSESFARIGSVGCSARGCHGAVGKVDPLHGDVYIPDGASTTWTYFDPHARAYAALLEPRSKRIVAKLNASTSRLETDKAHEAKLCLACHASVDPPRTKGNVAIDKGVDCESCHGPAEKWQALHVNKEWLKKSGAEKARDGMSEITSLTGRAQLCVECHVGNRSKGMDMNHDLIAAGHPRLDFEFSAYLAAYPKHWKEPESKPADFEAKAWEIGQASVIKASLDLLKGRAEQIEKPVAPALASAWPEFSESECFGCHHELAKPSWRQAEGRPGRPEWGSWPLAALPALAKRPGGNAIVAENSPLSQLRVEMRKVVPDPVVAAKLAGEASRQVELWIPSLEKARWTQDELAKFAESLAPSSPIRETWDVAAQRAMALEALGRAARDLKASELEQGLRKRVEGMTGLDFWDGFDSPRDGRPGANAEPPKASGAGS